MLGFGSIWGLYAFGALIFGAFTLGVNDSAPEVVAISLYGLTALPSCILAIWFPRNVAIWLFALSAITAFGFTYQMILSKKVETLHTPWITEVALISIIVAIPVILGLFLLQPRGASRAR